MKPEYRLEKGLSQSTVVSSSESIESNHSGSLKSKGWPNATVKQIVKPTGKHESHFKKPSHSYSNLITEAIKTSPKGQMTLNEIYSWLTEKFPYFQAAGAGWKVSL